MNFVASNGNPMTPLRFFVLLGFVFRLIAFAPTTAAPVPVIFDTDMTTDCDDAGALAVLHALADRGECEILATVASVPDPQSAATIAIINAWYARPNLKLGFVTGQGVLEKSRYTPGLKKEFQEHVPAPGSIPDAVEVYRKVLEAQPDRSVVIVTVGYLTNLKRLLEAPAAGATPSGRALIEAKVRKWVCMGGNFIGHPPADDLNLGNVNFQRDPKSALQVIHNWPGEVVFAGREVCSVPSGLMIGADLAQTPPGNPVRRAYELYFGGTAKNRHVADLASVLYAVRGLTDCWAISAPGRMELRPDMTFDWRFADEGKQRFLLKKMSDGKPNDRHVESVLNALLVQAPRAVDTAAVLDKATSAKKLDHVGQLALTLKPSRIVAYKRVPASMKAEAGAPNDETRTPVRSTGFSRTGEDQMGLHLHVFEPQGFKPGDQRACFITIHGGGWTGGNPERMFPFAAHFANLGMVGISVQYRLHSSKTGVSVFDCVKDARSAVRYVRNHAAEFGIDPIRIIVSGGSAGGHLAAATALFDEVNEAGESGSPVPNALVLLFPVIDTSTGGYGQAKIGERWRELSPVHHVRPGLPPTITFHGTGDTVTPFAGAKAFHEAMLKAGNRSELVVHEGGAHGYLMREAPLYDATLMQTESFLRSIGLLTNGAR